MITEIDGHHATFEVSKNGVTLYSYDGDIYVAVGDIILFRIYGTAGWENAYTSYEDFNGTVETKNMEDKTMTDKLICPFCKREMKRKFGTDFAVCEHQDCTNGLTLMTIDTLTAITVLQKKLDKAMEAIYDAKMYIEDTDDFGDMKRNFRKLIKEIEDIKEA